ncbi:uncharacterized protein LOC142750488 [Rhinoderma darwinii]|uniref:uncharacterized protein LOC142750488 n=1 Tax=Rhinoderma darwinii TaxID=43563 RepID=UPI003F676042
MSQNLSWGFLNLPLVTPPSIQSQILGVSMKSDLPTFLKICSDRLFPALNNVCNSMYHSISGSLQSLCLVLTSSQSTQMDTQFCTTFFSLLSDLLSDQCNNRTVRAVRSATVSCAYETWYNSSTVSPSDVSTCSESDREQFIRSVCGDQKLLNQLASQSANNWLLGFCAYNTNPANICHYVSWVGNVVTAFSVAYCWLNDQDQFTSFLCSNPNVLDQLKANVDNQWLDPTCVTVPPTNVASTYLVQELCNYEQWPFQIVNPSTVAFCVETDGDRFTQNVCKSLKVLQKLLTDESNSWLGILCQNVMPVPSEKECNYTLWHKTDNGTQSELLVDPSIVAYCSQVEETQFLLYVCNNPSLLLTLTKDTNNSWVLQFCINRVCNYTTWDSSSPTSSAVDLCWLIDQQQLNSYLCSHKTFLQNTELIGNSNISCTGNSTNQTVCSYNLWNLTDLNPSVLGYCAVQDATHFQTYICGNSFLVKLLKNNTETSWVAIFCNAEITGNISNCTDSLLNIHFQSCLNCNKTELEKIFLSVCNNHNLVRVLTLFWNSSTLIKKFIVWSLCEYSSWGTGSPPPFLVSYCWRFDNVTLSDFLCNHFQFYDKLFQETSIQEAPTCDPNKTCRYSTWDLTTLQISLVKYCADWDARGSMQYICRNSTVLKYLSENQNLTWVKSFCFGSISPPKTSDLCNYGKWLPGAEGWMGPVDFSTVYLCSKNDTMSFMMTVCNNSRTLGAISEGPALTWTLNLCYKLSTSNVLTQMLVWDVCDYSQTMTFTPLMVEFCWSYDQENFFNYLCSNLTFYTLIKTQPQNFWLKPMCTPLVPTSVSGVPNYSLVQCHNQYSNVTNLDISLIKFCAAYDQDIFLNTFCNATTSQKENGSCSWGKKLCSYYSWHGAYVHPVVVKACWATDLLNFITGVCSDPTLLSQLSLYSENSWLRPVCGSQSENQLENLVKAVCRYKEWGNISSVPGSIGAFCNTYNHELYLHSICDSQKEAICNDTIELWTAQNHDCNYANWETGSLVLDQSLMCWVLEKENFTTHVCSQSSLLSKLSNDPRTSWITYICSTTNVLNETDACLSENDKRQLQWNCSVDLSNVCPGNGLIVASFLPIGICYLQNATLNLPTTSITTLYTQAVDTSIILLLLLLADMQILSLSDVSGIQFQVLHAILNVISQETLQKKQKTELLQTFGNTLLLLIEEQSISQSWTIIEMLFNLTVSELKVCISSLQPKSAKYFLSILSQNQTSLQVSDDYFSMIVSTLLSVIVTSEPLLFYDVVPFLHYLEPDELIGLLPPLQDDKEVLQVLSHYAGSLSETQRLALGFWLRRSTLFQNLTRMDDTFILRVGNLLPLFSLDVFLQLSTQQVVNILPSLPWDLTPPYQRIVASKVLQAPNITVQDVELMGRCVCQADVQDLKPYGQNMDISLALRRNLFECVRRGDFFPDSMMLEFLFGDLQFQDIRNFSLESVPKLSVVIRSLGYNFLQGLRSEQLLPVLSDVASVTLTSAQARELVQKVLKPGNVSDEVLSHLGSLVLGISPTILQTLSANQLVKLLPGLTSNADMLSSAQIMAVFRTMWASGNVSLKLMELGPLLPSLPLIMLRTRSKEVLSSLSNLRPMAGVKWSQQQALLLIREATQMSRISDGVRSSANSVTGTNCDSLRSLLQDNTIQAIEKFRDVINSLPQHVVRSALDKVIPLPPSLTLLKSLSSQMIAEIQTSAVSLLPAKSCRHVLNILKSEAQSVAALPQQRRFVLLDALISCLNSAGTTSTQAQFIVLGVLTPFVRGSAFLTLSQGMMLQNVERVTNYCYPQETQLPLSQLLQETQGFGYVPSDAGIRTISVYTSADQSVDVRTCTDRENESHEPPLLLIVRPQ